MAAAAKMSMYAIWLGMPLVAAFALRLFAWLRLGSLAARAFAAMLLTPALLSAGAIAAVAGGRQPADPGGRQPRARRLLQDRELRAARPPAAGRDRDRHRLRLVRARAHAARRDRGALPSARRRHHRGAPHLHAAAGCGPRRAGEIRRDLRGRLRRPRAARHERGRARRQPVGPARVRRAARLARGGAGARRRGVPGLPHQGARPRDAGERHACGLGAGPADPGRRRGRGHAVHPGGGLPSVGPARCADDRRADRARFRQFLDRRRARHQGQARSPGRLRRLQRAAVSDLPPQSARARLLLSAAHSAVSRAVRRPVASAVGSCCGAPETCGSSRVRCGC